MGIRRVVTGWFRPNQRPRPKFMTMMACMELGCGHLWLASRTGRPCPKCASEATIPADRWDFERPGGVEPGKLPVTMTDKGGTHDS